MDEVYIAPKIETVERDYQPKVTKQLKLIDTELAEAEEEFNFALQGLTPRKRRLKIRDKEIEMSNHPENST